MAEHLSAFALDELSVGEGAPAAKEHLLGCVTCRAEVDKLNSSVLPAAGERAYAEAVARSSSRAPEKRRRLVPGVLGAALAAGVALWLVRAPPPERAGTRLKGPPELSLLSASDDPVRSAPAGTRVTPLLLGVPVAQVALVAVAPDGNVDTLWPSGGRSAPLPRGGRLPVSLELTPEPSVLLALYSAEAFDVADMAQRIRAAARGSGAPGDPALGAALPGAVHWVRAKFEVSGKTP